MVKKLSIRQSNGFHRYYPKVGCIRLTEGNREVSTVFRFLTQCTRMLVKYFVFTDSIQFFRTNQLDSIKTVKYFSRYKINLIYKRIN